MATERNETRRWSSKSKLPTESRLVHLNRNSYTKQQRVRHDAVALTRSRRNAQHELLHGTLLRFILNGSAGSIVKPRQLIRVIKESTREIISINRGACLEEFLRKLWQRARKPKLKPSERAQVSKTGSQEAKKNIYWNDNKRSTESMESPRDISSLSRLHSKKHFWRKLIYR